jgi:hypothetical protein
VVCADDRGVKRGAGRLLRGRLARCPLPLGALHEVIPRAEAGAGAGEQQHVHGRIEVGALNALGQRHDKLARDPVAATGPIEREARNAFVDLVPNRPLLAHQARDANCRQGDASQPFATGTIGKDPPRDPGGRT